MFRMGTNKGWGWKDKNYSEKVAENKIVIKTNKIDIKYNDIVTQEDLEKPDIEWEGAQGKSVNVPCGKKTKVEVENIKTVPKRNWFGNAPRPAISWRKWKRNWHQWGRVGNRQGHNVGPSCFSFVWWQTTTFSNITIMEQRSSLLLLFLDKRKQWNEIGHTLYVFFSFGHTEQEFENREQFY